MILPLHCLVSYTQNVRIEKALSKRHLCSKSAQVSFFDGIRILLLGMLLFRKEAPSFQESLLLLHKPGSHSILHRQI